MEISMINSQSGIDLARACMVKICHDTYSGLLVLSFYYKIILYKRYSVYKSSPIHVPYNCIFRDSSRLDLTVNFFLSRLKV
jgi:hypothetical protein